MKDERGGVQKKKGGRLTEFVYARTIFCVCLSSSLLLITNFPKMFSSANKKKYANEWVRVVFGDAGREVKFFSLVWSKPLSSFFSFSREQAESLLHQKILPYNIIYWGALTLSSAEQSKFFYSRGTATRAIFPFPRIYKSWSDMVHTHAEESQ